MFAEGIPADHVLAGKYRAEADTARQLPEMTPTPRLRWADDVAGWVVLTFDDIDGRHPQLFPGSPDIGHVVAAIARLAEVLTPCPAPDAPPATLELGGLVHGWGALATTPPGDSAALPGSTSPIWYPTSSSPGTPPQPLNKPSPAWPAGATPTQQ